MSHSLKKFLVERGNVSRWICCIKPNEMYPLEFDTLVRLKAVVEED